jgi:hypothetical protein
VGADRSRPHLLRRHRVAGYEAVDPVHAGTDPRPWHLTPFGVVRRQLGMTFVGLPRPAGSPRRRQSPPSAPPGWPRPSRHRHPVRRATPRASFERVRRVRLTMPNALDLRRSLLASYEGFADLAVGAWDRLDRHERLLVRRPPPSRASGMSGPYSDVTDSRTAGSPTTT